MALLYWQNTFLQASFNLKSARLVVLEGSEMLQMFEVLTTDVYFFERLTGDVTERLGHIREFSKPSRHTFPVQERLILYRSL